MVREEGNRPILELVGAASVNLEMAADAPPTVSGFFFSGPPSPAAIWYLRSKTTSAELLKSKAPVSEREVCEENLQPTPDTHLEKRSAMVLFFPRAETMDISLAVTLRDCDVHCERLKGTMDAMFTVAMDLELAANLRQRS